jgi:hypothetical protein
MSGLAVSVVIVGDGVEAGAIGPGSGATPGMDGLTSGAGLAEASAGRSSDAPASAATTVSFVCVFIVATPSRCYGMMLIE